MGRRNAINLYRQKEWAKYRAEQIKLHGGVCAHCFRSQDEVVLQVHHQDYTYGRLPWQYPHDECIVLCKGCHAQEHGTIRPSKDWWFIGEDDLGGLDGECEHCSKALRYAHMVSHPQWGTMIVGAQCCDKLTESTIASESHREYLNYIKRRKKFISSPNWEMDAAGVWSVERAAILIALVPTDGGKFCICLNRVKGKTEHATLLEAQMSAFDFVESGKAATYLIERQRKLEKQHQD